MNSERICECAYMQLVDASQLIDGHLPDCPNKNPTIRMTFSKAAFDWVATQGYATCTSDIQIALMIAFDDGAKWAREQQQKSDE